MPTYKRPYVFIERALNSILNQTYSYIEVIIVNDSPEYALENSIKKKIMKLNDPRIHYVEHEQNKGANAARNTGIDKAQGEYIAFLDDDDEWHEEKLEKQIPLFNQSENIGLVYCLQNIVNEETGKLYTPEIKLFEGEVYPKLIKDNFIGSTSFVVLKKEVLETCGHFNLEMQSSQDYELWLRISQQYEIRVVQERLVNYYIHNQERITQNTDKKIQGLEKIIELNRGYLEKHPNDYVIRRQKILPYYAKKYGKFSFKLYKRWFENLMLAPFNPYNYKVLLKILLK